jgi:hypothetical protein
MKTVANCRKLRGISSMPNNYYTGLYLPIVYVIGYVYSLEGIHSPLDVKDISELGTVPPDFWQTVIACNA